MPFEFAAYNSLADHPLFAASSIARTFSTKPFGIVDIGARGGAYPLGEPIAKLAGVIGFDPDEAECSALMADKVVAGKWAHYKMLPYALNDRSGTATLNLMSLATNHSLYPPNTRFVDRYNPKGMKRLSTVSLQATTLDEVVAGLPPGDRFDCEFIKLDTQGSELDILKGSTNVLRNEAVAVVAEVEFCEVYKGQPLFSDMEVYLRGLGFSHYGFLEIHNRSQKRVDKRVSVGRERIHWGDAVFFKDPFDGLFAGTMSRRQHEALFVSALLLKYFDFALEIAESLWRDSGERDAMTRLVAEVSGNAPEQQAAAVQALLDAISRNPTEASVLVGRFVDSRRHLCDYYDVIQK